LLVAGLWSIIILNISNNIFVNNLQINFMPLNFSLQNHLNGKIIDGKIIFLIINIVVKRENSSPAVKDLSSFLN